MPPRKPTDESPDEARARKAEQTRLRVQRLRQKRAAAGVPDRAQARTAIVDVVANYPPAAREKILEAVLRRTLPEQRDGMRKVAKALLGLTPPAPDPDQIDLIETLSGGTAKPPDP